VPDLTFSQPEHRSFLVPILLAIAAIALAIGIAIHFFPATTVNITHIHTDVLPTETTFKGSTIVGLNETSHILFVAATIKVDNQLRVPIYLDDFHMTLTDQSGAEMTVSADAPKDLPDTETNYPGVKPLTTTPLVRNTEIDPAKSAQGTLLFPLTIPKNVWDTRRSAVIKIDLYHQPPTYLTIPKAGP
jgi:hypothetical protein